MHVFIDKEQGIIAAGPAVQYTEKLPSAPFTAWTTTARIVIAITGNPALPYEVARQVLDDKGNHFEYQYGLAYGDFEKAVTAFSNSVQSLVLLAASHPPEDAATSPTEPLTPKQIAVIKNAPYSVVVARTYDVNERPRKGDFALKFEPEFRPQLNGYFAPEIIYRDRYASLKKMVENAAPEPIEWLDAAMCDL